MSVMSGALPPAGSGGVQSPPLQPPPGFGLPPPAAIAPPPAGLAAVPAAAPPPAVPVAPPPAAPQQQPPAPALASPPAPPRLAVPPPAPAPSSSQAWQGTIAKSRAPVCTAVCLDLPRPWESGWAAAEPQQWPSTLDVAHRADIQYVCTQVSLVGGGGGGGGGASLLRCCPVGRQACMRASSTVPTRASSRDRSHLLTKPVRHTTPPCADAAGAAARRARCAAPGCGRPRRPPVAPGLC